MSSKILNQILRNRKLQAQINKTSKVLNAAIPKVDDPTLQTWIKAIDAGLREAANNAITSKDLVDLGLAGFKDGQLQGLINESSADFTVPIAVRNLSADGAYSTITLTWETPKNKVFGRNVVYRSEINDFGTAVEIGSTIGDVYTDYIGNNARVYYWVRTVSKYDVEGELSPSVYAETSIDIPYLLSELAGKITSNQFTQSLKTEIERIPQLAISIQNEVNARLQLASETATNLLNLRNDLDEAHDSNAAAILNLQNTVSNQIDNIAQEISLVTAGVGEQFDTYLIWFFDEDTTEGWTSIGGDPTVSNGWIKPYINGADTVLISPPDNPFSGTKYPHIRFRVRKVGNPTWNARIYWGSGFNLYLDIPDPIWTEGAISTVQVSMDWIGTIEQIKLCLGLDQDANNYFIVDWFSFGRPSPSASWASLGEIKTAITNENYARTEYQRINDARWASNDSEYRALISQAVQAAADANGVTANRVESLELTLVTQYAGTTETMAGSTLINVGHVTEEFYRIEGDAALSQRIDQVYAEINDVSAAITQEQNTRAAADNAMAQQITTLQTKVNNDITAAIQTESQARAAADEAMAEQISTLQTTINNDITAAIQNEATARANADSAIAQTVSTVQSTVNGHTSSIQTQQTAINGLTAEWKIKVQAGGKVSGVSLGTTGTESQFLVLADRFAVGMTSGSTTTYPFTIDEGKVIMNTAIIKDGSIANAKIGSLSADKITAGNIAADRMKANALTAVKANLTSLSALTATIGTLRTKTSGARTEIKDNLIEVYGADNKLRVRIGVWD